MVAAARNSATAWQVLGAWRLRSGAPQVVVIEGSRRLPPLLCVLAVDSVAEEELAEQVFEAVADAYADPTPAALTTRLAQAVRAADRVLLTANADAAGVDRSTAALACLVQRGEGVYIARAGPAACHTIPLDTSGGPLEPPVPVPMTLPLGGPDEATIAFAAFPIRPQSALAVAVGPLVSRMEDDGWAWLFERPEARAVRQRLGELRRLPGVPDLTLALVAPGVPGAVETVPPFHRSSRPDPRCAPARATPRKQPVPEVAEERPLAALSTGHSRTVLAGILFALLLTIGAGGILLQRQPAGAPALARLAPLPEHAAASVPPPRDTRGDTRLLSSRGIALAGDDNSTTRGQPEATPLPTQAIAVGTLRSIVHVPGARFRDLALLDRTLIVVDGNAGRIVKHLLDPFGSAAQPEVLWQMGEQRGAVMLERPAHVAALEPARPGDGELAVATDDGGWWLLAGGSVRALPALPAPSRVVRLAAAHRELYALTEAPGAVWTLALDRASEGWKRLVDAEGARDLAADGGYYLLHADGQITRHTATTRLPFPAIVAAEPLQSPRAIATHHRARRVYVLEPARQRIVVLAKDGRPAQQLRFSVGTTAGDLHLLAQDEGRGWIVAANSERVYVAPVPR